jgi:hypothetical protein
MDRCFQEGDVRRVEPLRRIMAVVLAVLAGVVVSTAPAQAAPEPSWTVATARPVAAAAPAADSGRVVEVRLGLDCGNMSGKARAYAAEHNLCPTGPSTNTVRDGPCGKAWLFVVDDVVGDRWGRLNWGASSVLGPIIWRNFFVNWTFTPQASGDIQIGVIPDSGPYAGSTYDVSVTRGGGPALASGQLTGNVVLVWGGVCNVLTPYPSDFRAVT